MLYTAAMQSSPLLPRQDPDSLFQAGSKSGCGGVEVLGPLLLLKPALSSSSQHPPTQGHRVRGCAFRGEEAL